jgi:FkbM family methyltransferase
VKVRGIPLELHPRGEYVSDRIRETGDFYEADVLDDTAARLAPGAVIADVGAMLGNHSAYWAAFCGPALIHAFEPVPDNQALLRRNLLPYRSAVPHLVALSDHGGSVRMTAEPSNMGHARVDPAGTIVAPCTTLDAYWLSALALLKVDVEGHEREVLAGAAETIARCRPLVLIEDWAGQGFGELLPGYRLAAEWEQAHQTFLYEPTA